MGISLSKPQYNLLNDKVVLLDNKDKDFTTNISTYYFERVSFFFFQAFNSYSACLLHLAKIPW